MPSPQYNNQPSKKMNTFKEITAADADLIVGGIDAFMLGITVAVGGFVVANWTAIKQGFADGVNAGYQNTNF
jgi:hypothetical protein